MTRPTEWTCDGCGQLITPADAGYVVWRATRDEHRYEDFRIIHQGRCDPGEPFTMSLPLESFLGADGLSMLLSWLDPDGMMRPPQSQPPALDLRQFVDLVRRVQVPFYEQARPHLDDEDVQRHLADANEYLPYLPDVLERIANGTLTS